MFKGVKVSRPRKRVLTKDMHVVGFPEPTAERSTFLHRIIYIGEHDFPKFTSDMGDYFKDTISKANQALYISEKITGILIQYTRHFIHMIEGDEDCIILHLKLLFQNQELSHLSNMKLLLQICHVNDRLFTDWSFYHATPSKLLETIEDETPLEEISWQIRKCIEKIYKLIYAIVSPHFPSIKDSGNDFFSTIDLRLTPANNLDRYRKHLPEIERLNYILNSQYPVNLEQYFSILMIVPQRHLTKDEVWPVPADFIPYDVLYSEEYDIKTVFPSHSEENIDAADEDNLVIEEYIESEPTGNAP